MNMRKIFSFMFVLALSLYCVEAFCQSNSTWENLKKIENAKKQNAAKKREQLRSNLGQSTRTTTNNPTRTKASSSTRKTITKNSGDNKKYTCPQCGGSGKFALYPGDVMSPYVDCAGCQGHKMVTQQEYYKIIQDMQQVNKMLQPTRKKGQPALKGDCPTCKGTKRCTLCGGKGFRLYENHYSGGNDIIKCSACNQSGNCPTCGGTGKGI